MSLAKADRRAYAEARYQRVHGRPSDEWRKRPGSSHALEVWMTAYSIAAAEENVSPWDALLLAVKRRAARVRAVDRIIEVAWQEHRDLCASDPEYPGNPDIPSDKVRVWMVESRNEERLLTRAAKMAVDAGVADAMVRRLELEGQLVTDALLAGIDALDLTPDQRILALTTMHTRLNQMAGKPTPQNTIEGVATEEQRDDDGTEPE